MSSKKGTNAMGYAGRLAERELAVGRPVRVGVVGAGQMGRGLIAQVARAGGMEVAAVADVATDRGVTALQAAGRTDVLVTDDTTEASAAVEQRRPVVMPDGLQLADLPLDIVIEVSGIPDVAAQVALSCLLKGRDVALMTVEADVTVGPLLSTMARAGGAIYTVCRGDEPVECLKLVEYANDLGLKVIAAGKGKNNPMRPTDTPDDVADEAARKHMNPKMLCSFTDGTKTQIEMAALANATGFALEVTGMHGIACDAADLATKLTPTAAGGILTAAGPVVEYVTGDVAPGVFIIIEAQDDVVTAELEYLKLGPGPYFALCRPFHLASIEALLSIGEAVVDRRPSFQARHWTADVIAHAKADLLAGTVLEGIGGHHVHGTAHDAAEARGGGALPIGLAAGCRLTRDVRAGQMLTYADVEIDETRPLVALRRLQDSLQAVGVLETDAATVGKGLFR